MPGVTSSAMVTLASAMVLDRLWESDDDVYFRAIFYVIPHDIRPLFNHNIVEETLPSTITSNPSEL